METEEEKALKANLIKDHAKEKAKDTFDKLSNIVKDSANQVKRTTLSASDKAEDFREKAKKTVLGRKEEKDDSVPSQDDIYDPEEPGQTKKRDLPKPTKRQILEFIGYIIACVVVYVLGYLHYTFLLVFIPILLYVIYAHQKTIKNEKALLFKEISELGEEQALRARLKEFPSWFNFPDVERVEWINEMARIFWPHISVYGDRVLRLQVEPVAREALEKYKLWGFKFRQIQFGRMPPRITGIKVYKTSQREEVVMDVDIEYYGDADIAISLLKVTASVGDVQVEGKLRIILKPLIGDIPIVGGIQIFFVKPPMVNFDLGGAASILDFPGLNSLLRDAIQDQIALRMLVPNKVTIILTDKVSAEELKMPRPVGVIGIKIIEAKNLTQTDSKFEQIDPYVIVQQGVNEKRTSVGSGRNPSWNELLEFAIEVPESEELQLLLYDKDRLTDDDFLGQSRLNVSLVAKENIMDTWATLDGVESGQVHYKMFWLPTSKLESDYLASKGSTHSRAILMMYLDSCTLRPIYKNSHTIKIRISVGPEEKETQEMASPNFVFQQGFTFFLKEVQGEILHMKVVDAGDEDNILVVYNFSISQLQLEENLSRQQQTYDLPDNNGCVKFAARLKYLVNPSRGARDSVVLQRASNVAGKLVQGAARNLGHRTTGLARNVGTSTSSAVKSFGIATSGAVNYIGNTSSSVFKKSPKMPARKDGVHSYKVMETNLDEGDEILEDTAKGKLPTTYVADMGGSQPDLDKDQAEKESNENIRRRLSDNFRYFKR